MSEREGGRGRGRTGGGEGERKIEILLPIFSFDLMNILGI